MEQGARRASFLEEVEFDLGLEKQAPVRRRRGGDSTCQRAPHIQRLSGGKARGSERTGSG